MKFQLLLIICGLLVSAPIATASSIKVSQAPNNLPAQIEQAALQEKILLSQGQTFLEVGQYKQSMAIANKLLRTNPNLAEGWLLLGNSLSKLDRSEEALIAYDQALKLNQSTSKKPDEIAILWGERARVLDRMSRYQEAVSSYDEALKFRCLEQAKRINEPLPAVCDAYIKPQTNSNISTINQPSPAQKLQILIPVEIIGTPTAPTNTFPVPTRTPQKQELPGVW